MIIGILIALVFLWVLWAKPSECFDKHGEFSFSRYFFGAILGTIGIALFGTMHIAGGIVGFLMAIGGFGLQNREKEEYNHDPE